MKKLLIVFYILPMFLTAQIKIDSINKLVSFSKVYEVPIKKAEINQKVKEWIALNFKDSKKVVQLDTADKSISKGYFTISFNSNNIPIQSKVYFAMEVAFKEGKYKLEITNLMLNTNNIESPASDHFFNLTTENYIKILEKLRDETTEKYIKKYYDKLINNPDEINKQIAVQQNISSQIKQQIIINLNETATSLNTYILKKTNDNW